METAAARLQCLRQMAGELAEKLIMRFQLLAPGALVNAGEFLVAAWLESLQPDPIQILIARNRAERGLDAMGSSRAAIHDPFQHAHVLRETGPDEFPAGILPKP